jgi:phage tail sheath protein FI
MPIQFKTPGVYINELSSLPTTITPAETSITAFLGRAFSLPNATAPTQPTPVSSFSQFQTLFGGLSASLPLTYAVRDFFTNGGTQAIIANITPAAGSTTLTAADYIGNEASNSGLYQLNASIFNILCIPPDTFTADIAPSVWSAAATFCQLRNAMLIVDPPTEWSAALKSGNLAAITPSALTIPPTAADNVAVYLPRIIEPDPLNNEAPTPFAPSGAIAGIWAQSDTSHGVWKSPSGTSATLVGVSSLEATLTDQQNATLTNFGINALRTFPSTGAVIWGARTLASSNTSDYRYIPVRRLVVFIESSISQGTKWVVFEPNDEPLWAALRLAIGAFFQLLYKQGALQGTTPTQAYFVKCDAETTTQTDIDNGIVNITVGFAPLKPAEFVVIQIQQLAGQSGSGSDGKPPTGHS